VSNHDPYSDARTEQIATDPAPRMLEQSFGTYSVEYEQRACLALCDATHRL